LKIKRLIELLKDFNPEADITTPISEDICLSYVSCNGMDELTKKTTKQVFIEPTDSCPICTNNYMDESTESRWCSFYDKPCKDVKECYQWEDEVSSDYIEDRYEGWITQS